MNSVSIAISDSGPDRAAIFSHLLTHAALAASESGPDTIGSTLMEQVAAALEPLVAGGAWPGRATIEPILYPYITFFRVVTAAELTFDGLTDMQSTRLQIDVFTLRYGDADALLRRVIATMLGAFVVGSVDSQDFPPDPSTDAFRCMADLTLWSTD